MNLRIATEARCLDQRGATGIARYVRMLVEQIPQFDLPGGETPLRTPLTDCASLQPQAPGPRRAPDSAAARLH